MHPRTLIRSAVARSRTTAGDAIAALAGVVDGRKHIALEYPPSAARPGGSASRRSDLRDLIAAGDGQYAATLDRFLDYADDLAKIAHSEAPEAQPRWINGWLPGLDSLSIYGFVRQTAPATYFEIGSGNTTRFAVRAIADARLDTRVVSVDPHPREAIDAICDEVVRAPLELADLSRLDLVQPGDIVLFDGSHRLFSKSDVAAFFIDVLPALPADVLVAVHDIYLPYDYPPELETRWWSENQALAIALVAPRSGLEIALPCWWVSQTPELAAPLNPLWQRLKPGVERHGGFFWMRTTDGG